MNNSDNFFKLVSDFKQNIDWLNSVLLDDENSSIVVNGTEKPSISKAIKKQFSELQSMVSGRLAFETKADLENSINHSDNTLAEVWNDSVPGNNGLYGILSGKWFKSVYDVISALSANKEIINVLEQKSQFSARTQADSEIENLLNPLAIKRNSTPSVDGYAPNLSYDSSDFIVVNPSATYWVRSYISDNEVNNFAGRNIYWYNNNRELISGVENTDYSNGPHKAPDNACFVKISWKNANANEYLVYFGESQNPLNPEWKGVVCTDSGADFFVSNLFCPKVIQEQFNEDSVPSRNSVKHLIKEIGLSGIQEGKVKPDESKRNIFNPETVVAGKYMQPTGEIVDHSGYSISDYIPVAGATLYTGNYLGSNKEIFRKICFFDKTLTVVNGGIDAWNSQFITPDLTAFVVVTVSSGQPASNYCLLKGESYEYYEYDPVFKLVNILNPFEDVIDNTFINPDGSIFEHNSYRATGYIPVESGKIYTASIKWDLNINTVIRKTCFFDVYKRVVPGGYDNPAMTDNLSVPDNVKFVRISVQNQYPLLDYCLLEGTEKQYKLFSLMSYVRLKDGYNEQFDNPNDIVSRRNLIDFVSNENNRTVTLYNSEKILFTGCSYDEGGYSLKGKNWIDRLSERHDYICGNYATGGYYILAIANSLAKNQDKYGITPNQFNPTYITIANNGNEPLSTFGYTLDLYKEQILLAKNSIENVGAKMILGTNHQVNGNQLLEANLKSMALELGVDYMGIGHIGEKVMSQSYRNFWKGSHPNVRGLSFTSGEWQYFFEKMPRPKRAIKVFRPRSGVQIEPANLSYDNNDQRVLKFKEILLGGRSMNDADGSSSQYDRMTLPFTMQENKSEYAALLSGKEVFFYNAVLVEFITNHIGIDGFNAVLSGSEGIQWYVMNNRGVNNLPPLAVNTALVFQVSESDYFNFNDDVGKKFTSLLVNNGNTEFSFDGKVKSFSMGRGYFLCFTSDSNNPEKIDSAGVINRVSGGSVPVIKHLTKYTYHYKFWSGMHQPSGKWEIVPAIYHNSKYCIENINSARKYQQYDKIKLLGLKSGKFSISGMQLTTTGGKAKPQTIKEITQKPTGLELIEDRGFDKESIKWNLNGNIVEQMPESVRSYPESLFFGGKEHHVSLTKDDSGFGNPLSRIINVPQKQTDLRGFQRFVVRVIARVFPKIYDPDVTPDQYHADMPQITHDSCDYGSLLMVLSDGSGADFTQRKLVDVGWQEIIFETSLPPFVDQIRLDLLRDVDQFDTENEIQLFDVSCQLI